MPFVISLHSALPDAPAGEAPLWVHLCPARTFSARDGRGPYRLTDAAAVIQASMDAGRGRLLVDENHATDHAQKHGGSAPAAGWMVELQSRDDGIWARMEWTDRGRVMMADKAYRGLSPALLVEKGTGEVCSILRASLTNLPNLTDLVTLHSEEPGMDFEAQLRKALGLADSADQAAIVAAVSARQTALTLHSTQLGEIATLAGVPGKGATEIVSALTARGDGERDLAGKVVALQTQLSTLQASGAKDKATATVDAAIAAGKPIKPLRNHYITRHTQDPGGVEAELNALPSINAGGLGTRTDPAPGADGLTAEDRKVIALMGLDPEAYKKQKAALNQEVV